VIGQPALAVLGLWIQALNLHGANMNSQTGVSDPQTQDSGLDCRGI
jgi:hypothetical protein